MTHSRRRALGWVAVACFTWVASAQLAHAQLDLTGAWTIELPVPGANATWMLTQTGTALTVVESASGAQGTGTVDAANRTFQVAFDGECGGSSYSGAVTTDDLLLVGTAVLGVLAPFQGCGQVPFAFTGARRCGNGTLDPDEDCDDANAWGGDCCSPACRFEAAGAECVPGALTCVGGTCDGAGTCDVAAPVAAPAGTPCRRRLNACDAVEVCDGASFACPGDQWQPAGTLCGPATGPCDVPEYCDGASPFCPAPAGAPDGDGDGIGDPCDRCLTGERLTSTTVMIRRSGEFAANDKLTVNTTITPSVPIDPVTSGLSLVIGRPGDVDGLIELSLPPGAYDPSTRTGWSAAKSGQGWSFRGNEQFESLVARVRRRPPDVQIKLRGRRGFAPVLSPRRLIALQIVIGPPEAQPPVCAEAIFNGDPAPAPPQCTLRNGGRTLDCRA